jgi:hypothetical protein
MRINGILGFAAVALLISSCQKSAREPLVPAAGTVRAVEKATGDIATARCDHEQRCNHIGSDMRYSDREHCMNVMRSEARDNLNQCHAGLDDGDVRECLTQIANQDCSGVFAGLAEYKACQMDDLCK